MRILTFSTLYPNAARPIHGIFVETRLRQLVASGQTTSKVVAPVPWFPSRHAFFGDYARHASAPRGEWRYGIEVLHPRYPLPPKIGMTAAPLLLALAAKKTVRRVLERYAFDAIDAHYLYPDGVAAALLARWFGKPVVMTARGTDVTLIPNYRLPRLMIRWAAREAAAIITVSRALKDDLVRLGVAPERITVLRNGVDLALFRPVDRSGVRAALEIDGKTLLSVGHLVPRKAHDLVIRALPLLPEYRLVIVGDGPERAALGRLASALGVSDRVRFVGAVPQEELVNHYGAADALVLASTREGWANVLLEAMACGTPVIASNVGGASELVTSPEAGILLPERTPQALAQATKALFRDYPERGATRRHAERFSWAATTRGQLDLFERVIAGQAARVNVRTATPAA
jgi:glycosyltransferase involved in cell wall biosynthesis